MNATSAPVAGSTDLRAHLANLPDAADIEVIEVAAIVGCCHEHISRQVKRGKFPKPYRIGRLRRWNLGIVRRFLRDQAEAAQAV